MYDIPIALGEAVGIGLLHFTWIALLLGTLFVVALHALRGESPKFRLRGQGAVPWQAILTRYAVKQGDIMGFFLPADDRDDCLLVLLRVEPYTPA